MITRREVVRQGGILALALPLMTLSALVERPPKDLPNVVSGQALTAASYNALIDRVNELSR